MVRASKFNRFRSKIEKKLIGNIGSSQGLGSEFNVYTYPTTTNTYGDKTLTIPVTNTNNVRGIIVNDVKELLRPLSDFTFQDDDLAIYFPYDVNFEDTISTKIIVERNGKYYIVQKLDTIGEIAEIGAMVQQTILRPYKKILPS